MVIVLELFPFRLIFYYYLKKIKECVWKICSFDSFLDNDLKLVKKPEMEIKHKEKLDSKIEKMKQNIYLKRIRVRIMG